jgi:hypothetical protein
MAETAALIFAGVMAALCLFQIALAAGAPLGRFAWGGAHERLPTPLRVGSLVSLLIYGACTAMVLDRAKLIDVVADNISHVGAWVVAAFLSLGVVMNAISRSKRERFTMTPVAFVLAACAYVVAMS